MWDQVADLFQRTVVDGALIAAVPVAAVAGLVSFASPCVLPLLPGYVGYLGGMAGAGAGAGTGTAGPRGGRRGEQGRLLAGVLLFVAGFTAVFVLLSLVFAWAGVALAAHLDLVLRVLGVLVILMGLAFVGYVPFLQRDRRLHLAPRAGLWGAPLLGVAFGLGWAPCIGPTLAAVLTLALGGADPARGVILAVAYCLGLGVPFVLVALFFARSARMLGFLRRHRRTVQRLGGGLLVLLGVALVTGWWSTFSAYLQGLVAGFETVV
ncbi:cytochrome c biogenesis CcdA family protein [Georgenia sp. TF02-10]|nr:cytochrome c biogenesis CcdA family protein [Georgenia sp. TF02-10]UNX54438.1 cytochrome c biogenesis CcdA family protein [Georgenia sp. TF02-10]